MLGSRRGDFRSGKGGQGVGNRVRPLEKKGTWKIGGLGRKETT